MPVSALHSLGRLPDSWLLLSHLHRSTAKVAGGLSDTLCVGQLASEPALPSRTAASAWLGHDQATARCCGRVRRKQMCMHGAAGRAHTPSHGVDAAHAAPGGGQRAGEVVELQVAARRRQAGRLLTGCRTCDGLPAGQAGCVGMHASQREATCRSF